MKYLKRYKIPFSGLSTGKHNFEFDIDEQFFECFEHSIVKKGQLTANVELQKQENMLVVEFDIQGKIRLDCDVCLQEFDAPLAIEERVLVKFVNDEWNETSEEIIVLSPNDYELDISTLLYEFINVSVPYYIKCEEQGEGINCDPEMLTRQQNEDDESTETKDEEQIVDPRWEVLRKIKKN